jgi:glycosyltransferase involved in cell wall biosynthesis
MAGARGSILIDARVNGLRGAHGIARSVLKLAAHMPQADDGLALRVLVNPGRPQLFPLSELPDHAELIETDITLGGVHRCWELARLIRAVRATVLYVPYPTFTPFIRPCPIVVTLHDCTIESDVGFAGGWHRQAGLKLATRLVLRRATAITAPSRASLAQIRQHYPSAPSPTLVSNGVDVRQFGVVPAGAVAAARDRYQLPEQFILTVGAHRPHKNHEILVRALAELPAHMSLVIVGLFDRSFPNPLPGLIAALGLESRVRLVPDVADELLPAVYRAAKVFAFPSLAEGYGLPALEAMASGVPVVASDIPALAEVTGSGALLVPPCDVTGWVRAITAILADPGICADLSAAGAAVAAGVSWERGATALRNLLSAVGSRKVLPPLLDASVPDASVPDASVPAELVQRTAAAAR